LQFSAHNHPIVSFFSGKADLTVSNTNPPQNLAQFFVQRDEGGTWQDAPQDKGASGGIKKMEQMNIDDVKECPASGYESHWFRADDGGVYCVLTRDGLHYAKVRITSLQKDRIALDWIFQPATSRYFQ
jgi:hypothetical protein